MREEIERRLQELGRRAGLVGVPPAAIAAALLLAAVAVLWAAWRWWPGGGGGEQVVVQAAGVEQSTEATAAASETPSQTVMVVHVVGAVRRPGVYELPSDARVQAAVDAAGGPLPDAVLAAVNLARTITDGEQIVVPTEDEVASGAGAGAAVGGAPAPSGAAAQAGGPVDLNSADAAALDALPGIGPATAQKIVADRESNGPFSSVDDLGRVSGIGPKKLEGLKDLACVR